MQTQLFLQSSRGGPGIDDTNDFGHCVYFLADADIDKYYFRIISALNLDKRICLPREVVSLNKIARFPGEKKSCHVSGCYGFFFGSETSTRITSRGCLYSE